MEATQQTNSPTTTATEPAIKSSFDAPVIVATIVEEYETLLPIPGHSYNYSEEPIYVPTEQPDDELPETVSLPSLSYQNTKRLPSKDARKANRLSCNSLHRRKQAITSKLHCSGHIRFGPIE